MKKTISFLLIVLAGVGLSIFLSGCGEGEKNQTEMVVGHWTLYKNRTYILLVANAKGDWSSTVRITDVTSKVVKSKGNATGMWHIEAGQMIVTVMESDIEDIWQKNATRFYDIVELNEAVMHLRDETGYETLWKRTTTKQEAKAEENLNPVVSMGPIAVNLNKNRSNDKDRYLCMNLSLVIKELMPGQEVPPIHPRAREAAMIFLSSLVFNDVKDFDRIKAQNKRLLQVMNPHMEGVIKEIRVEHVIVAADIDKVEEFMIEHTIVGEPAPEEGEEGKKEEEKT